MKSVKLSEVCIFNPPKNEARLALDNDQLVSFMPMQDLGIESIIAEASSSRPLGEVIKAYTYFAENDVLIAKITPCFENGKMGIARNLVNGVGFGSSEYFVLRPMDLILSEYLYYFLRQEIVIENGREVMSGAVGHRRVPVEYLENLKIPLPSLKEQVEIVEKLDKAFAEFDLMEEALSLSISKSNELMQSLLSASLVSSETELGSSNSLAKQIFDMKTFKLSEVCSFSRGLTYSKGDEVEHSSNVVLRANNIDLASNSLNLEDLRYIKQSIQIKKEKIVKKDSIIICTASGSKSHVGKVALIDEDYQYAFGGFMGQITPLSNCHHKYLYYILTSGSFKEYLMNLNDGTNINNLKFSDIEDYEFLMPSLENQLKIVQKLDKAFVEIESLKSQISFRQSFASVLRQSLLSSVFIKVDEVA